MASEVAMKEPWLDRPDIWPTQAKYMSWLRGGLRRGLWMRHPIKLELLNKKRFRQEYGEFKNGKPKTRWAATCELCQCDHPMKDIEVDHRVGHHSLQTLEDITQFIYSIVLVSEDDLQLVCKPCHEIKSYADKHGLTFEQARAEKEVIKILKLPAAKQKQWLQERGVVAASNPDGRAAQVREALKNEVQGADS